MILQNKIKFLKKRVFFTIDFIESPKIGNLTHIQDFKKFYIIFSKFSLKSIEIMKAWVLALILKK